MGLLPVLLVYQSMDPGVALAQYPLRARTAKELAELAGKLRDPAFRQASFVRAWNAINPGREGSYAELHRLLAGTAQNTELAA
ncbi:MAG: hypothetical protein HC848_06400 [Limnobacter sp.]|nr:hypothetical protein [Limnobacter sp.]